MMRIADAPAAGMIPPAGTAADMIERDLPAAARHGATRSAPLAATERPGLRKKYQLGVLLVHGVGSQPAGDTLVRWGDVLLKTIRRASRGRVNAVVETASIDPGSDERCPQAVVRFGTDATVEWWLLAEGWWAGAFPPPSYRELVSWGIRALPWSISLHFAQRYWSIAGQPWTLQKGITVAATIGQLLLGLALAPVAMIILLLTLLLAWLPAPQLRSLLLALQSSLTATVGDSLAFVESPVRAALIRTRILEGIRRIDALCERCIVVAHSQGAAAALDVLGGIAEPFRDQRAANAATAPEIPALDTLLTFGAGTNQLVSLKVLASERAEKDSSAKAGQYAVGALLVIAGTIGWLVYRLETHHITLAALGEAAMFWFAGVGGALLVGWSAQRLVGALARRIEGIRAREKEIKVWALAATGIISVIGFMVYASSRSSALGAFNGLMLAVLMLMGCTVVILSRAVRDVVTDPVQKPRGVARWIDISASADPVSNGPTRVRTESEREYFPVWNQGSLLRDHTTYWSNLDGFVLRVARICADTAGSAWRNALPRENPALDERAVWRLGYLILARWCTGLIWLFLLPLLWMWDGYTIPVELPGWVPASVAGATRFVLLPGIVALAAWVHMAMQSWIWRLWVERDQVQILDHRRPESETWFPLLGMFMLQLLPPLFVLRYLDANLFPPGEHPLQSIGDVLLLAFGAAGGVSMLLVWRKKPPPWRDHTGSAV